MGHGNSASRRSSLVWDELLERWFQGQIEHRAGYGDHTGAHKSSSEVYGKIEGFTSPAV